MSDDGIEENVVDQMRIDHEQYHAAVNHPIRKAILELLKAGSLTLEELVTKKGLTSEALSWHIAVLESGKFACIEKENRPVGVAYGLTKAGRVINYLE
jgi:DNA-binding transcriptional ArsR family regulator